MSLPTAQEERGSHLLPARLSLTLPGTLPLLSPEGRAGVRVSVHSGHHLSTMAKVPKYSLRGTEITVTSRRTKPVPLRLSQFFPVRESLS